MATRWPAAALLACSLGLAAALSCKPCEQTTCSEVKCAGRMVRDVCDCCLVCARAAGQPCGGYFDSLGVCDDELVCQTSPRLGQAVDTGAEGICTKNTTDCQYQLCQLMLGTCVCTQLDECRPPDVAGDPTTFTSRDECEKAAHGSQLSPTAAVTPPAAVPACPGVDCDPGATSCPADSVLKTTPPARPDCCPPVGVCLCDLESCSAAAGCPAGQQAVQVSAGRQQPGLCCSRWQCKAPAPQTNLSCSHDGNTYGAGETWQSKCTVCQCKDGLTFCQSVECPTVAHCAGKVTHRADQCCPQCVDGCLSPSGVHHNSSEQWLEDDCTTCSCLAGSLSCQSEMCHISCRNPRPVPGRCCPVCDECDVRCQHGYRTSQDGRQLCQCLTAAEVDVPPPACRSMATCRRQCPHGFKVDDNGCERCKCKKCRKLKGCTKKCAYGLMTDDRECAVCRCRSRASGHPNTVDLAGQELSCVIADGSLYEEDEQWHDGCRQCYCHGGLEMCSVISCPVPRCDKPDIADGHCCPTCPDGPGHPPRLNVTVCQAVDGQTYVEGQLWQLDACTRCVCHSGRVLCSSPACAPAPCVSPDRPAADCCATCAVAPSAADRQAAGCRDEGGVARSPGETWRQGACVSCLCQGGEVSCFHEKCRPLDCDRPVLKKGRCCPFCLEAPRSSNCVHRNRTMATGQTWDLDPCTTCTCEHGDTVCTHKTCAETCTETAADPGNCCPTCKDDGGARGSTHLLAGVSKATHRTVVRPPPSPTQTSHHGVERQPGESQSSHQYIVLCVVIGCLVLVLLAVLVVWWVRRQRSGYSPKHITEEKKPLNDPQIMHFVRLDGRGLHQDTLILEKNGAVVREA